MTDTIVQEVREIRATIAAEFGYDRARYLAWARKETKRNSSSNSTATQTAAPPNDKAHAEAVSQS